MAQHGALAQQTSPTSSDSMLASPPPRPAPLARVHRPRLAIVTPPPPTTVTLQPLGTTPATSPLPRTASRRRQPPPSPTTTTAAAIITTTITTSPASAEVTLTAPRPDGERTVNEYVETPFRPACETQSAGVKLSHHLQHYPGVAPKDVPVTDLVRGAETRVSSGSSRTSGFVLRRDPHHQTLHLPISLHHHNNNKKCGVVTKQPGAAATFKKDPPTSGDGAGPSGDCFRGSIICADCGRCRCDSCRQPRPLPSRWLCNNGCFCSAETSLDYASCLCCVKGLFYHCSKDYEMDRDGTSCADDPCSCGPHRLLARWGCLAVLSLMLPCLWCYWPLKGCVQLCERCYARYSNQGCRCEPRTPKTSDVTPEKRLLDTSPDF